MFEGFSPETVDFLWGIRLNNNREWFLEHKKEYTTYLYEPMKALGQELFEPFIDEPGAILKVSRIYRDARMHHPTPYKESLWLSIRQDVQWWAENPCQFLDINPEGINYGMLFWKPKPVAMEAFRKEIARDPDTFLTLIRDAEKATGVEVTGQSYKRPKPCENPKLAPYYSWKDGIACIRHEDFGPETFSPELAVRARDFLTALTPLTRYFCKFGETTR